jgi:hypothetical protein
MYSGNETGNAGNCMKESSDAESEAVHSKRFSHYQHVSIREKSLNFESTKNEKNSEIRQQPTQTEHVCNRIHGLKCEYCRIFHHFIEER